MSKLPRQPTRATLLAGGTLLSLKVRADGAVITVPAQAPDKTATVIALDLAVR